jgi:hypothetical protein
MYKTTKSPRKVLLVAYAVAQDALPAYSHKFSPRKFTQHQFFAVLALKEFMRCDYRKIAQMLKDCDLRQCIDMEIVPHWTAIHKACQRLLRAPCAKDILRSTLELARKKSSSRSA